MQKITTTIVAAGLLLAAQTGHAAPPAREGLWEYTTKMEMPGMPVQPVTQRICLSGKDMEEGPVPKEQNCKFKNYKLNGNTATWQMECTGEDKISSEGKITYQNDTAYSGESRMRIQSKGEPPMEMTQKFSAKRVGDCKK